MNSANYVETLIEELKKSSIPLSDAVWETAIACIGWPYVFGAAGAYCTPSNRKARASDVHPTIVSKCQVLNGSKASCTGCQWYPDGEKVRMFDCRGFTRWCLAQFGIQLNGAGCTSQWNDENNWAAKGKIEDIPDDVLVCLFYSKDNKEKTWEHTGFGFRGETVECSVGVQHFTKRNKKWTHWAIPKGIDGNIPDYRPTLRRGSTGEYVTLLQTMLINKGYDLGSYGADGKYGAKTEAAVKAFQRDWGLKEDGICGPKTWEKLDSAPSRVLYTVHIPYLTADQADALILRYPGSTKTEERG